MDSLQEIESAIRNLSSEDQATLARDLPQLLPQFEGELAWRMILNDPTPSTPLSRVVDRIDAEFRANPESFPKITDAEFERHQ